MLILISDRSLRKGLPPFCKVLMPLLGQQATESSSRVSKQFIIKVFVREGIEIILPNSAFLPILMRFGAGMCSSQF
ncbi:hypothetical protein SP73_19095 [Xanthomonas citri pv. fuscans]|nr:hypothetical protein NY63_20440 [Xanthomonas citri pv. fuscans]KIF08307.1 hypothetical protein SP73_19095 [Xanthomonas citri pv. fuscans]